MSDLDWGVLGEMKPTTGGEIRELAELGRRLANDSAAAITQVREYLNFQMAINHELNLTGGNPLAKAKKATKNLEWITNFYLPRVAGRFAGLPTRIKSVYEQDFLVLRQRRAGGRSNLNLDGEF